MFAKFSDTVKQDSINRIPKEVLAAYNAEIPKNVCAQYVDKHNGTCELVTDLENPNTQITVTIPAAKLIDTVPDYIKTQEELEDYMYRMQKGLHYRVEGKPYMEINGFKVCFDDLVKHPYDDYKIENGGELYIVPHPFPKLKPLLLVADGLKIDLDVKRIPDERKDVVVLQTDERFWLQINMELSVIEGLQSKITMISRLKNCKTIEELLSAFKVIDALANGNYMLSFLETSIPIQLNTTVSAEVRRFWEKAGEVEKILNVQFDPNVASYQRDIDLIQKLFQCLVLKNPFASFINEAVRPGLHATSKEGFEENVGKAMAIAFVEKKKWDILGASFETYDFCCIFDAVIADIIEEVDNNEKPYFISLAPVEGKKMRIVTYIATSEEETSRFQRQFSSHNELLRYLSEVKSVSE